MNGPPLVLASASPRRLQLLRSMGWTPEVQPADIDETPLNDEAAHDYVLRLARTKAEAAADPGVVRIAADTTVVSDGSILEKPTDVDDARRMLRSLSGGHHKVLTGVAVAHKGHVHVAVVTTEVVFVDLAENDIEWYISTGEPFDKAGAYAVQGQAAGFIRSIVGSITNVIGLPLAETVELIRAAGIDPASLRSNL